MKTKSIFQSKTFWLNLIVGVLAIIALIDPTILIAFGIPEASQMQVMQVVGVIVAVLNLILRMITGQPIALNANKASDGK